VACAFCAHGLAGAGGIGKTMAEWIIEGNPEWDVWRLDVRRFGPNYASQDYMLARTLETYGKYYDIHYPNEERESGRPLRLSPAYFRQKELGAFFGEKFGWERVNWFTPHEEKSPRTFEPRGWARKHWSTAIEYEHVGTRERADCSTRPRSTRLKCAVRARWRSCRPCAPTLWIGLWAAWSIPRCSTRAAASSAM
jgi:4-methylaminobutanoate oxidase (formaldehyde-forming)